MKKLTLALGLFILAVTVQAQTAQITKQVDDMTDKVYLYGSSSRMSGSIAGRTLEIITYLNTDFSIQSSMILVDGIGCIDEGTKVIILFEDGTKLTKSSFNKFNCKGYVFISLSKKNISKLCTSKVKKIRVTNSRNYKDVTCEFLNPNYFIELKAKMDAKEFKLVKA